MDSISRDTYVAPAALETVTGNGEPPIASLPTEILGSHIFPYLGAMDLGRVSRVCRGFNVLSRALWQQRAREIRRACAELLPSFGTTLPGPNPSPAEAAAFLDRTVQRVREIQNALSDDLRSQFSTDDLVCKVDPAYMLAFLQKAYDHSLRTVFGELAHVPEGASLEESVRLIKDWLQTAEARGVETLCLKARQLCCLPGELGQLTALAWLYLNGNRLMSLPPEIGRLTALRWLHLNGNQLSALPPEIGQLKILQRLELARNRLDTAPPELWQLTALETLNLNSNQLTSLPKELGRLTALQGLDLGKNQLASLPPEIERLTELRELSLSGNQLTSLSPEIGQLTALRKLFLEGNRFTIRPEAIERLKARNTHCLIRL